MQLSDFVRDGDGFLENRDDWTPEFARQCAAAEGVEYTHELDAVVQWAREFYAETNTSPRTANFTKYYADRFGKGHRREAADYLAKLTNGAGVKRLDKIAGLPKPTGCV